MLPGSTPARLWARRHSAASASVRAGRAANDVMVIVAGIAGGGLSGPVVGHRPFDGENAARVVADDEVERGGWLGWFGRGHESSPVSRCDKDIITYRNRAARFARRFYLAGSAAGVSGAGARMEFAPALTARMQPDHRARWRRQRLPSGDGPDVRPRVRVVGDPRKSPAQLDSSRQLTLLAEDGADRVGIGLGDEEHPQSMTCAHHGWQMKSAS